MDLDRPDRPDRGVVDQHGGRRAATTEWTPNHRITPGINDLTNTNIRTGGHFERSPGKGGAGDRRARVQRRPGEPLPSIWITSSADTTADEKTEPSLRAVIDIPSARRRSHSTSYSRGNDAGGNVKACMKSPSFSATTRQAPAGLSFVRASHCHHGGARAM